MRRHATALLCTAWAIYANAAAMLSGDACSACKPPTVQLNNGTVVGSYNHDYHQDIFLGIPYAAPPTGDSRFHMPAPPVAWNGSMDASSYGPRCFGNYIGIKGFSQNTTDPMSEDCLHLNVIRPSGTEPTDRLPVLVWIHGGGWQEGSASDGRSNGSFLVQRSVEMGAPIIFASFNYRLGLFGMLAGSAVREANITNLGLHDQRQALAWIQENIGVFGGDSSMVTVMGESAGAVSIGFHLLAYGGRDDGLFSAAITQSGGPFSADVVNRNRTEQEADLTMVLNATGCLGSANTLDCLREVPAHLLNELSLRLPPYFVIDGELLPDTSILSLEKGKFIRVPLLTGSTRNEGTSFTLQRLQSPVNTEGDFQTFMRAAWGGGPIREDLVRNWTKLYQDEIDNPSAAGLGTVEQNPGLDLGALYGTTSLWMGDMMFTAGRRFASQAWARYGIASYSFFFDTVPANADPKVLGAAHFLETPYTFGNTIGYGWTADPFPRDRIQRRKHVQLATLMSSMWISFATTRSPNFHQFPGFDTFWPVYTMDSPVNMRFSALEGCDLQPDTWRDKAIELVAEMAHDARPHALS